MTYDPEELRGDTPTEPRDALMVTHWRTEVVKFANLMEQQLRANDHKPGWERDDPEALLLRLDEERDELDDVLLNYISSFDSEETQARELLGRECADVANFLMMIADVCGALSTAPTPDQAEKRTMCIDLTEREREALERLMAENELSDVQVFRQALKGYQLDHERHKAGETVTWSGDAQRARDFARPPTDQADTVARLGEKWLDEACPEDWRSRGYESREHAVTDLAQLGDQLIEAISDVRFEGSPIQHWLPAESPAEIVSDLVNMVCDARQALATLTPEKSDV